MTSITNDTIVAPATTYGKSSINIIRLSGKDSKDILDKLAQKQININHKEAKLIKIYFADGSLLDECIAIYFRAPNSYTTEDVVEIQCHGGYFIAKSILSECIKHGARIANAGEFTKRAFLGGRIDLSQAQAIAKLIESKNKQSHNILMRHLSGEMRDFCHALRQNLIELLAHSEVFIDYSDEDLPNDLINSMVTKLENIAQKLQNLIDYSKHKQATIKGHKICIIGKPNVGKSTLLNTLLNEDRAITSEIAGTTRDSIEAEFIFRGHSLLLIDTAGIRDSKDLIEQEGIKRSLKKAQESDILIAIFDISKELTKDDAEIINMLKDTNKEVFVLINKNDLPSKFDIDMIKEFSPFKISLKDINATNEDSPLSDFKNSLEDHLNKSDNIESLILSSEYQYHAINNCIEAIKNSKEPLLFGELELFSFHVNVAIKEIAKITKPYEYSEVLDSIFSDFCLGK